MVFHSKLQTVSYWRVYLLNTSVSLPYFTVFPWISHKWFIMFPSSKWTCLKFMYISNWPSDLGIQQNQTKPKCQTNSEHTWTYTPLKGSEYIISPNVTFVESQVLSTIYNGFSELYTFIVKGIVQAKAQVNQVKVPGYFLDRGAALWLFSTKKVRHQQREFYRIS